MDTLPTELHSQIFSLAISYDRHAYAALSLTCRYFHTVALPLRFQSICLSCPSSKTLEYLSDTLDSSHRVRELYISDADVKGEMARTTDFGRPQNVYPLTQILSKVAPTLESLTFISSFGPSSTSIIGYLYSLIYPRLAALSILGFYPIPRADVTSPFPKLESLWLSGNRNPSGMFLPGTLDAACPNLKHLTLHGVYAAPGWAVELQRAASPPTQPDPCAIIPEPRLPSTLKTITVQPGKVPSFTGRVMVLKDEEMKRVLKATPCVKVESTVEEGLLDVIRKLKSAC